MMYRRQSRRGSWTRRDSHSSRSLRIGMEARGTTLAEIVEQIVPELTKLNPAGTVHAKSVYATVNTVRRAAPGPR